MIKELIFFAALLAVLFVCLAIYFALECNHADVDEDMPLGPAR